MKKTITILIMMLALLPAIQATKAAPDILLLSNSIDYNNAPGLLKFLDSEGHNITYITASDFEAHKSNKFILILGGPDAPQGVGGIVQQLLTDSEKESLRNNQGKMGLYINRDLWADTQIVMVIAGNKRTDTKQAMETYKKEVHENAAESRLTAPAQELPKATLAVEDITTGIVGSTGHTFLKAVAYSLVNTGSVSFYPTVDIQIMKKKDQTLTEYYFNSDIITFNETFEPNDHWLDNVTHEVKLDPGNYRLVLSIRAGTEPEPVVSSVKEFTI